MRWKIKYLACDQIKYEKRFAFLPVYIRSMTTWIWVEYYWKKYATYGNQHWKYCGRYFIEHSRKDATGETKYV